jgi:hypothetical protein
MAQTLAQVQTRLTNLYALYDQLIGNGGLVQKSVSGAGGAGEHAFTYLTPSQVLAQIKELESIEADLNSANTGGTVAYAQFKQPG